MKWFKHDSNANMDVKLKRLRKRYGAEGYGVYWLCLELIAGTVEKHNLTFELEYDAELIADELHMNQDHVQDIMGFMVDLGLFENDRGVITCLKMATRTDEYTQQLIKKTCQSHDKLPRVSRDTPESVPRVSESIEEKRIEEKDITSEADVRFDLFWDLYPKKEGKKKARTAFLNLTKKQQQDAVIDIKAGRYMGRVKKFVPLATTYIHGERWNDEPDQVGDVAEADEYMRGAL